MTFYTPRHISLLTGIAQHELDAVIFQPLLRKHTIGDLVRYEASDGSLSALTAFARGVQHGKYLVRRARKGDHVQL